MRALTLSLLLAAPAAAHAIDITVTGSCPGPMGIGVDGVTPGDAMAMFYGPDLGDDVIPFGRCGGTATGLSGARFAFNQVDSDADGMLVYAPTIPDSACDMKIQAVDLATCEVSPVVDLIEDVGPGPGNIMYAADGRGAIGSLYTIDTDTGAVIATVPLSNTITGLGYDVSTGTLYGIVGDDVAETGSIHIIDPATGDMTFFADATESGPTGEYGLAAANGTVLASDNGDEWVLYDAAGSVLGTGETFTDEGEYGADLTTDADGNFLHVNADFGYTFDAELGGFVEDWASESSFDCCNGGGASMHNGTVWLSEDNGEGGTDLYTVDGMGEREAVGITIPSDAIDAIASTTP